MRQWFVIIYWVGVTLLIACKAVKDLNQAMKEFHRQLVRIKTYSEYVEGEE